MCTSTLGEFACLEQARPMRTRSLWLHKIVVLNRRRCIRVPTSYLPTYRRPKVERPRLEFMHSGPWMMEHYLKLHLHGDAAFMTAPSLQQYSRIRVKPAMILPVASLASLASPARPPCLPRPTKLVEQASRYQSSQLFKRGTWEGGQGRKGERRESKATREGP